MSHGNLYDEGPRQMSEKHSSAWGEEEAMRILRKRADAKGEMVGRALEAIAAKLGVTEYAADNYLRRLVGTQLVRISHGRYRLVDFTPPAVKVRKRKYPFEVVTRMHPHITPDGLVRMIAISLARVPCLEKPLP